MHAEENVKNLELCSARLCCVLYAALRQVPDIQQLTWLLGAAAAGSRAAGGTEAGSSGGSAPFLLAYARLADAWAALQTADSQVGVINTPSSNDFESDRRCWLLLPMSRPVRLFRSKVYWAFKYQLVENQLGQQCRPVSCLPLHMSCQPTPMYQTPQEAREEAAAAAVAALAVAPHDLWLPLAAAVTPLLEASPPALSLDDMQQLLLRLQVGEGSRL